MTGLRNIAPPQPRKPTNSPMQRRCEREPIDDDGRPRPPTSFPGRTLGTRSLVLDDHAEWPLIVPRRFHRLPTNLFVMRNANPGATSTKRTRKPAAYPNRVRESIFAAPSMSPEHSAPMANTPHTSSPEKPERSMPQHRRTAPDLSIGILPVRRRNRSRLLCSSDLQTPRRDPRLTRELRRLLKREYHLAAKAVAECCRFGLFRRRG